MLSFVRCDVLMTLLSFGALGLALSGKRSEYAVKETHHVPRQWSRIQTAPKDHLIRLQIALKQSQFSELERHLYEVSDPSHVRYGQHLSQEDVHDLVKPSSEALSQVHEWLESCNVTQSQLEYTPAKDWIKVTLPVETIERLLDTEYSVFQHRDDGTHLVRTTQWSLPMYLHEHIDAIQPTNSFFRPGAKRSQVMRVEDIGDLAGGTTPSDGTLAKVCNVTAVTPDCLRTLYGTIDYTPAALGKNQIALTNYLGEVNNRSDVSIFLQKFRPEAVSAAQNFTTIVIDNGDNDQGLENSTELSAGKDLEGNLDAETIIGITYPTKLTTYNVGGSPPFIPDSLTPTDTNEPYLTWLQYMLNQTNDQIPQVISTSYGDNEQTIPLSYATAVCNSFAQLGARGVTVLFASGDNGVGPADDCFTNDGKNTSTFLPAFPAGCPYVTTVGGTKNVAPEIVAFDDANGFVSGGGFSNYFARPYYQDTVVPAYVTNLGDQFSGLYNGSGRGYPDIAAQGFRFLTIWNGTTAGLDGTSAATPTAASIISLVNDALLAAGKPVLGFMNPWLYSTGYKAFTDVTDGSALGCNTTGFPAATGWDAVTGFGTPYFPRVQAVALGNGMCHDFVPAVLHAVLAAIFVSGFVTLI